MTERWININEFQGGDISESGIISVESGQLQINSSNQIVLTHIVKPSWQPTFIAEMQVSDQNGILASLGNAPRRFQIDNLVGDFEQSGNFFAVAVSGAEVVLQGTGSELDGRTLSVDFTTTVASSSLSFWVQTTGGGYSPPCDDAIRVETDIEGVNAVISYWVYADDDVLLSNDPESEDIGTLSDSVQSRAVYFSASQDTAEAADLSQQILGSRIADAAVTSDSPASRALLKGAVFDAAVFGGLAETGALIVNAVVDVLLSSDLLSVQRVYTADLADSASIGDQIAAQRQYIADLVDAIALSELAGSRLQASAVVASAIAAADALSFGFTDSMTDSAVFNEALSARLAVATVAVDSAVFSDLPASQLVLTFQLADSVQVVEQASTRAELIELLADSAVFSVAMNLSGETIYGYVCNAETKAFTSYANYPFNSFAKIGHDYYGMSDDGLYLLTGDDDSGEPIEARIRTALTTLGTAKQKRMPSVYFGLASNGRMVLKAITTSGDGEKREDWYLLEERNAAATRETRTKLGRGLKSVYWGFELVNVDGASFELDTLQLFPMILERRL